MNYFEITGPCKLKGSIQIAGAKNAALPILAATLLSDERAEIGNMPNVVDTRTLLELFRRLGSRHSFSDNKLIINNNDINSTMANYEIVKQMRASVLVLGPLLSRFGHCEVSLPGGCAIGQRPIDLHLSALEKMGAKIEIKNGYVVAVAPSGLHGSKIVFDKITVGGTENIVMAAALAKGETHIINAAIEPEVVQLCEFIKNAGVDISGIGTSNLKIQGTNGKVLQFKKMDIIPDRIEAGTYLCAAAITNSEITLQNINKEHLGAITNKLEEMGFTFLYPDKNITIMPGQEIKPISITTKEYPGFPTDMQAQFMALAIKANGTSTIEERLFENRFMHVSELQRLGAEIHLNGHNASIEGPCNLLGADVMATDLRASSALVIAALVANGVTKIHRIYHLDRGYENMVEKLTDLGVNIKRLSE